MRLADYCTEAEWKKIRDVADTKETPFLVVDLDIIRQKFEELTGCFPMAKVHYALKANPGTPVIELLRDLGSNFDIASIFELNRCSMPPKRPPRPRPPRRTSSLHQLPHRPRLRIRVVGQQSLAADHMAADGGKGKLAHEGCFDALGGDGVGSPDEAAEHGARGIAHRSVAT